MDKRENRLELWSKHTFICKKLESDLRQEEQQHDANDAEDDIHIDKVYTKENAGGEAGVEN